MTMHAPPISIAVDPCNPGEFFACCGLLELADRLWRGAEGWFTDGDFQIAPVDERSGATLADLLCVLTECSAQSDAGPDITREADSDQLGKIDALRLTHAASRLDLRLDWWMMIQSDKGKVIAKPTVWKLWAGQQSSLSIWKTLSSALRGSLTKFVSRHGREILRSHEFLSGRFGFDPGAAWNALDIGFSPNEQGMKVATSPFTELLAAIGLQRFRPSPGRTRAEFVYATWALHLSPGVAKAAASCHFPWAGGRRFRGRLSHRGSYKGLEYSTQLEGASYE
jgi:CRISPR-associated protein Csx14